MQIRIRWLAVVVLLSWGAALQAAADQPVILVFGDSLSAGYRIAADAAWPKLLQSRLHETGYPYRVVNASISGHTTSDGLARLPQALAAYSPAIVILELGGNDGLRGYPVVGIKRNLARLIELAQAAGARVLLAGIRLPPNYGKRYTDPFYDQYADLARSYDTAYLPFLLDHVALNSDLMQSDGLHPTAAAQSLILDNVWPVLVPLLNDK